MSKFENVLNLPVDDLVERRKVLEEELKKTVVETVFTKLKNELETPLKEAGVGNLTSISWEYYPESDDEGGSVYYPNYIQVFVDGEALENIDNEDDEQERIFIKHKPSWGKSVYEESIEEFITGVLCDYRSDLYDYDIEEITFEEE